MTYMEFSTDMDGMNRNANVAVGVALDKLAADGEITAEQRDKWLATYFVIITRKGVFSRVLDRFFTDDKNPWRMFCVKL
jgi:hypothetical protein